MGCTCWYLSWPWAIFRVRSTTESCVFIVAFWMWVAWAFVLLVLLLFLLYLINVKTQPFHSLSIVDYIDVCMHLYSFFSRVNVWCTLYKDLYIIWNICLFVFKQENHYISWTIYVLTTWWQKKKENLFGLWTE